MPLCLPSGLEETYCQSFLDYNVSCKYGKACNYKHALIPVDITKKDLPKIIAYIESTEELSFHSSIQRTLGASTQGASTVTAGVSTPSEKGKDGE